MAHATAESKPNVRAVDGLNLVGLDELLDQADIILALVAHRQFKRIPITRLAEKVIVDTCGAWR